MAASEALALQPLHSADAPGGLALSAAAGWNQTSDDWGLFITHGHGVGCRDDDGRLVATAAALPYDGGFGWISMVLVDPAWRHRGLATALMQRCAQALRESGHVPVLDATPAGAEVYRRIGFNAGFALDRWEGEGGGTPLALPAADAQAIVQLDRQATGLGRAFVLQDFLRRDGSAAWLTDEADGFLVARRGHRAWQLGPLVASDEPSALALLQRALAALAGRVFLDVPRRWSRLTAWLSAHGFTPQRGFVRMALCRDGRDGPEVPERVFVLAGPEFG
ncbi:MAG: GNAT family N-acetyltransferase [Rubrivivax sp.]